MDKYTETFIRVETTYRTIKCLNFVDGHPFTQTVIRHTYCRVSCGETGFHHRCSVRFTRHKFVERFFRPCIITRQRFSIPVGVQTSHFARLRHVSSNTSITPAVQPFYLFTHTVKMMGRVGSNSGDITTTSFV